jgi:hypothetical protein
MNDLTLVVIGKDAESIGAFQRPKTNANLIYVANSKSEGLAVIANRHLDLCCTTVFGLCHADVVFANGALEAFTSEALRGSVCGIVGVDLHGTYHCSYNSDRDRWWKDNMRIGEPGFVSTLDGMAVFFRKDLGLRFDEQTFCGFHCHVEDLCLQAHARGIPVTVPAADAHHRNHKQTQDWLVAYHAFRRMLTTKWSTTEFRTT